MPVNLAFSKNVIICQHFQYVKPIFDIIYDPLKTNKNIWYTGIIIFIVTNRVHQFLLGTYTRTKLDSRLHFVWLRCKQINKLLFCLIHDREATEGMFAAPQWSIHV